MRVSQESAFILHARDYRESSQLVEVITRDHGRLALMAKGAKRPKSRVRGILRPFQPLLVSWAGRGELPTLTGAEAPEGPFALRGDSLYCGFYANELLLRLLHRYDAHQRLFDAYEQTLRRLADGGNGEVSLRLFEKRLLQELGYALVLDREADSGAPIVAERRYRYLSDRGPVPDSGGGRGPALQGSSLLALAEERLHDRACLKEVKRLMRSELDRRLNGKPLHTRRLWRRMRDIATAPDGAGQDETGPASVQR